MPRNTDTGTATRLLALRLAQVAAGTALMGLAVALLLNSALGLLPLDILHRAIGDRFGWTIGTAIIIVQSVLMAGNVVLRVWPGIGTVASVVIPAVVADATLSVLPAPTALWLRAMGLVLGGAMFAAGSALYLAADLGALPRDGLMFAIAERTRWSLARIRVSADLICLTVGAVLAGPVTVVRTGSLGVGSVLLALALGPVIARLLPLMAQVPGFSHQVDGELGRDSTQERPK